MVVARRTKTSLVIWQKSSDRPTLYVWYLGQRYADKAVPWHFPFVMTLATVPVFALIGLICRLAIRQFCRIELLLIAIVLWPMVVFALPGTPVYDATRLFLMVMPGIALLSARGVVMLFRDHVPNGDVSSGGIPQTQFFRRVSRTVVVLGLTASAVAVAPRTLNEFAICDYNLLVGGPGGSRTAGTGGQLLGGRSEWQLLESGSGELNDTGRAGFAPVSANQPCRRWCRL